MVLTNLETQNNKSGQILSSEAAAAISLGEVLKEKRCQSKIEISQVAAYLRVKESDVSAIENNELDKITHHLYIPGLLRSYGRFLQIEDNIIEQKIRLLSFKSNVENKKHILINIGEENELTPSKDAFLNFLLVSILLFLVLLSIYNSIEDRSSLITNQELISNLEKIGS